MESSTFSLMFKGSISEAIVEAQIQKKLFVVYISGEDEDSILLEQSTWADLNVAEAITKHCVFLHLIHGSVDAVYFSACYPQKSVPNISAIGFNGILLWQHEGYVNSEKLIDDIQKAWLSLHFQETAATILTAAMVSKIPENSRSVPNAAMVVGQGNSSSNDFPSSSTDKALQMSEAIQLSLPGLVKGNGGCEKDKEFTDNCNEESTSTSTCEKACSTNEKAKELQIPETIGIDCSEVESRSFSVGESSHTTRESITFNDHQNTNARESTSDEYIDHGLGFSQESDQVTGRFEANGNTRDNKADELTNSTPVKKSSEVHLNIRMPDGASLQAKFSVTDSLRSVKRYVDESQVNDTGSYSLAIPYPRKIFSEQDMSKALSELGLVNREALITVPHRPTAVAHRGQSLSHPSSGDIDSSSNDNRGYFEYIRRVLSYINPYSYFSGSTSSSTSEQTSNEGLWQYRPNPALQNSLSGPNTSYRTHSPSPTSLQTGERIGKNSNASTARFGSNIHTLKHDEDDDDFKDRNAFWNGNSTQYGGDDRK